MPKKSPEQKAEEECRYILACGASNTAELEPFLTDPNQAIRVMAFMNSETDAEINKVDKLFKVISEMPSDFYAEERVDEPSQERE